MTDYVLTLVCPDAPGIVHAVTGAILGIGGNVTESQQYTSADSGRFCQRLQVTAPVDEETFAAAIAPVADEFGAQIELDHAHRPRRTLILASTAQHCVGDLLTQMRAGQLPIEVPLVLANHENVAPLAAFHGVPFEHRPIASPEDRAAFEDRVREVIAEHDIELVVLARYMQILSPELCDELAGRCINIHHSFLPGFKGVNPYRQAYQRGVKQIGATAHFVTTDLDEGPIIEQNVTRVDHTRSAAELTAIGQDEEVRTLRTAVRWFAQSRVLLDGRRTIIFR